MSKVKYPAVFFLVIVIISLLLPVFYYKSLPSFSSVSDPTSVNKTSSNWKMTKITRVDIPISIAIVVPHTLSLVDSRGMLNQVTFKDLNFDDRNQKTLYQEGN